MDFSVQRQLVQKFYEEQRVELIECALSEKRHLCHFNFDRIASVEVSLNPTLEEIEIIKPDPNMPETISKTLFRHLWYSQWNFANLYLLKIPIEKQSFFFLFALGVSDDAWDNDDSFIEIFNSQGDFLCSTYPDNYWEGHVNWLERQFTNQDCKDGKRGTPPPPWSGDEPHTKYYNEPLWTEEILITEGSTVEQDGAIIRYLLP